MEPALQPRGPLCAAVVRTCEQLRAQVPWQTAAGFDRVLARLASPLQVAVAGRIKSGKSTLVNALIGRQVAPTAVGECTKLVTRFQYGTTDRIEVIARDGNVRVLPFDARGMIPAEPGVDPGTVSHIEVYLTNAVLRDVTVIDTPGLGSTDTASSARAQRLIGAGEDAVDVLDGISAHAIAGAEAILYVMTQDVRADDAAAIAGFTAATGGRDASGANVLAVLNKVDTLVPESVPGAGDDIWQAAWSLAGEYAAVLRPKVADVLPVVSLVAQACETGDFATGDADALLRLSQVSRDEWDVMTTAPDIFSSWECAVPSGTRQRLLETLDLYGIRTAVAALRDQPGMAAGTLRGRLAAASGFGSVRTRLDQVFRARADGIKAAAAITSITALAEQSGEPAARQRVNDALEVLLATQEAHELRLLEAVTLMTSGAVEMPADLVDEVLRVACHTDPGDRIGLVGEPPSELAPRALERAGWWRSFAGVGASPAQAKVAYVVHRSYFLMWQRLRGQPTHGGVGARGSGA